MNHSLSVTSPVPNPDPNVGVSSIPAAAAAAAERPQRPVVATRTTRTYTIPAGGSGPAGAAAAANGPPPGAASVTTGTYAITAGSGGAAANGARGAPSPGSATSATSTYVSPPGGGRAGSVATRERPGACYSRTVPAGASAAVPTGRTSRTYTIPAPPLGSTNFTTRTYTIPADGGGAAHGDLSSAAHVITDTYATPSSSNVGSVTPQLSTSTSLDGHARSVPPAATGTTKTHVIPPASSSPHPTLAGAPTSERLGISTVTNEGYSSATVSSANTPTGGPAGPKPESLGSSIAINERLFSAAAPDVKGHIGSTAHPQGTGYSQTEPASAPAPKPMGPEVYASNGACPSPHNGAHPTKKQSPPPRLTMYPPNHLAHGLFRDVRRRVQAGLTRSQRGQKICWSTIASVILLFGLILFFVSFATAPAIAPVILIIFVFPGLCLLLLWLFEKWQHLAPDLTLKVMGEILDGRAKDVLLGRGGVLCGREPPVGDERGRLVVDLFPDGLGPFRALQRGGYASVPSWATYHAAWKEALARIEEEGEGSTASEMHGRWLDVVSKMAGAADGFAAGLDRQRMKAYRRLARQGLDFAGDTLSDLADIGGMFSDLRDIKSSLEDIRDNVRDAREAYKDYGMDSDWEDDRSDEGLHPIMKRRLAFILPLISACFFLPALSFGLLGVPAGAWAMAGFGILMIVASVWFSTRINGSLNLLECVVDCEVAQRSLLENVIKKRAAEASDEELLAATADLRRVLMENYYAALAIHLQTEALTFRPFPYPGNPPMLGPGQNGHGGGVGGNGAAAPSAGPEEPEIAVEAAAGPSGQDEPVIIIEGSGAAGPSGPQEPGIAVVEAGGAMGHSGLTKGPGITVDDSGGNEVMNEPMGGSKVVEMTIKPDGTRVVTRTTTTKNPDGTMTTIRKTSIINGSNAEVPDYFHDEETGMYQM